MGIYGRALRYGYSNTRAKVMEAKLLGRQTMQAIVAAPDRGAVISLLIQTDYGKALTEFGGLGIRNSMIDFALSRNMAERLGRFVDIAPKEDRAIIRSLTGKLELSNVKLAIEAKERGLPYESIAQYVVDYGRYNATAIKETMRESNVVEMLRRLEKNSPYSRIMADAIKAYESSGDAVAAAAAIDLGYYGMLENAITRLLEIKDPSVSIIRMDIDMKNLLTLIRGKARGMPFQEIQGSLIPRGGMDANVMRNLYSNSENISAIASKAGSFDLKQAEEQYRESKQLILFEIAMRNQLFNKSLKMLRHAVLSFSALLAYVYLKETEIFALRILVKSKIYGLSKDETSKLITWSEI